MKVLVLGGGGMLGSTLSPFLKSVGWNVISHSLNKDADVNFDASDKSILFQNLARIKPDVVINLIALTSVEKCEAFPNEAYILNSSIPKYLGDWVKTEKCHLIHISTDHVYDSLNSSKEEDIVIRNYYALTKYAGDLACESKYTTILRTNFVGKSDLTAKESLSDWVYNSLVNNLQVEILSDVYFNPVSMNTLCRVIQTAIENKEKSGIYNIGSEGAASKASFDLMLGKLWNFDCLNMSLIESKNAIFLKANRPNGMVMNSDKFQEIYSYDLPTISETISSVAKEYDIDE